MKVITSNKGGQKIAYKGHLYLKNRTLKSFIWWSCVRRKHAKCRGSIKTTLSVENPVIGCAHNHDSDPAAVKVTVQIAKVKDTLKGVVRNGCGEKPSQIVAKTLGDLPKDFKLLFPKNETVRKIIQHERSKVRSKLVSQMMGEEKGNNDRYERSQIMNRRYDDGTCVKRTWKRDPKELINTKQNGFNYGKITLESNGVVTMSETNSEIQHRKDFYETFAPNAKRRISDYESSKPKCLDIFRLRAFQDTMKSSVVEKSSHRLEDVKVVIPQSPLMLSNDVDIVSGSPAGDQRTHFLQNLTSQFVQFSDDDDSNEEYITRDNHLKNCSITFKAVANPPYTRISRNHQNLSSQPCSFEALPAKANSKVMAAMLGMPHLAACAGEGQTTSAFLQAQSVMNLQHASQLMRSILSSEFVFSMTGLV